MKIEIDNFEIYSDVQLDYMDEIIKTLNNQTATILSFFKLEKLRTKKKVVIWNDITDYHSHLKPYVKEVFDWMCADTFDGNINLLAIEQAKKTKDHSNMTKQEFISSIIHEFVHSCQQEINSNSNGTAWYWEALATNLSGQYFDLVSLDDCDFEMLQHDFNGTNNGYSYAYTIGRYMLQNYEHEQLLEYVHYPELLKQDANKIFEEAISFYSNKKVKGVK